MHTFTAKQLTKLAPYPRLAYVNKLPGMIAPDRGEPGQKNKEYSPPMAFKWGYFAYFDSKYQIDRANALANAAMAVTPWIFDNYTSGDRLWFVDFGNGQISVGISYADSETLQPEEKESRCLFSLFGYSPEICPSFVTSYRIEIWVNSKKNLHLTRGSEMSGSGAGFSFSPPKKVEIPKFRAKHTTMSPEVRFYCISDIFENIAEQYELNPYETLARETFMEFQPMPQGVEVDQLHFKLS